MNFIFKLLLLKKFFKEIVAVIGLILIQISFLIEGAITWIKTTTVSFYVSVVSLVSHVGGSSDLQMISVDLAGKWLAYSMLLLAALLLTGMIIGKIGQFTEDVILKKTNKKIKGI